MHPVGNITVSYLEALMTTVYHVMKETCTRSYIYGPGRKCLSITILSAIFAGMKQNGSSIYAYYY